METLVREAANIVGITAEVVGVLIVAIGMLRALFYYVRDFSRQNDLQINDRIRLNLGRSLVLALEFLLAADIVRTAVAPTWEEIGKLAAIAFIRTILNYFLQREIAEEQSRISDASSSTHK